MCDDLFPVISHATSKFLQGFMPRGGTPDIRCVTWNENCFYRFNKVSDCIFVRLAITDPIRSLGIFEITMGYARSPEHYSKSSRVGVIVCEKKRNHSRLEPLSFQISWFGKWEFWYSAPQLFNVS